MYCKSTVIIQLSQNASVTSYFTTYSTVNWMPILHAVIANQSSYVAYKSILLQILCEGCYLIITDHYMQCTATLSKQLRFQKAISQVHLQKVGVALLIPKGMTYIDGFPEE